jgi:hypothetical protein
MKSKHTKGDVKFNEYGKIVTNKKDTIVVSGVMLTGRGDAEPDANAQLIVDAFNVTNETGLTPRELQKSHAELLEVLEKVSTFMAIDYATGSDDYDKALHSTVNQAIKNAKP